MSCRDSFEEVLPSNLFLRCNGLLDRAGKGLDWEVRVSTVPPGVEPVDDGIVDVWGCFEFGKEHVEFVEVFVPYFAGAASSALEDMSSVFSASASGAFVVALFFPRLEGSAHSAVFRSVLGDPSLSGEA